MKNTYLILALILVFTSACTDDFEEINSNTNVPLESSVQTLLPAVIFEPINSHVEIQTWLTDQIMHYFVRRNDNQLDAYDFAFGQSDFDEVWRQNYAALQNATLLINDAQTGGFGAYEGAGRILRAYYLAMNTELWIDVPNTEAGLGESNITPSYDSQQEVYQFVLQELQLANSILAEDDEGFSSGGDILFNGDVMQWRRLANSLRLRYLLRLSNKAEINAASEINAIVSDQNTFPIIDNQTQSASYDFSGVNPDVADFALRDIPNIQGFSMSKRIEENYASYGDPRVDFFFTLPNNTEMFPNHEGIPNGITREAAQSWNGDADQGTSFLTTRFSENPGQLDYTFISHAEVQFILAEAALKGWISTGSAKDYYEAGIQSNFDQWDISVPDGFFEQEAVAFDNTMERLMDQKWFAFFFNNTIESWGEFKRTGLPNLELGSVASSMTNGQFATRVFYPPLEQSVNSQNYNSASQNIGGDIITARHWYQN